ncbi:MAG: hypothetical protein ACI9XU_001785 [Arenicella sp.]|jgi:hypothetical protein
MNKLKLHKEKKEILKAFEAGDCKSNLTKKINKEIKAAAEATYKKDKHVNIR